MNHSQGQGCDGCLGTPKGCQELLEITRSKAKTYAVEEKKTVAIFREGFEFLFCEYSVAVENGYPIIQLVSQHS